MSNFRPVVSAALFMLLAACGPASSAGNVPVTTTGPTSAGSAPTPPTVSTPSGLPAIMPTLPTISAGGTALPALPPPSCTVTTKPVFVPPAPYPATPPAVYTGQFWYGSADLWTMLGRSGTWVYLQLGGVGLSQKLFWWRQGYNSTTEQKPALTVTAGRLDVSIPTFTTDDATNASADFGDAMLVGVTLPTGGCWKITGHYHGHDLSYIVWVAP